MSEKNSDSKVFKETVGSVQDSLSFKTTPKIMVLLSIALLMVALGATAAFWAFKQIEDVTEARKQSYMVINKANGLFSALKDAETGQRGYALTGEEEFLQPYLAVRDRVSDHLKELRQLTFSPAAQKNLDELKPLVDTKLAELKQSIELRRHHDWATVTASITNIQSKQVMDAIRAKMTGFIQIAEDKLVQQEALFQSNMRRLFIIIVTASLFGLLFAVWFAYLIYRESQQRLNELVHHQTQSLLDIQQQANEKLLQTNAILRVSEDKLTVTLNSIGDAVIATDTNARITLLNPVAEQLTGWTLAEAIDRHVEEIFHIINPETRQLAAIPILETLANGSIRGLANHTVLVARDGSEFAIADSCAPIRGLDGQVVGAVLIFRDVSEEYAAEQTLRDSNTLIHTILNTMMDGIITFNASTGIVRTVNPAIERMFGYTPEELIGQQSIKLISESDQEPWTFALDNYTERLETTSSSLGREGVGRRKDGSAFPFDIVISEMWLGGQRYFSGILRDITQLKQVDLERTALYESLKDKNIELESARSLAEKANLAKSEFLSSMSHELRTPLNAILGFAQLLEAGPPSPTDVQTVRLQQILKAGWYLLDLINEILDLALIESGKLSLSREPVLLIAAILECQAMIEPQAQERGIKLNFIPFDITWVAYADRTRLKQVLINLLSNALKYNRDHGSVEVKVTTTNPEWIRISIIDNGAGLSPEKQKQLFQPFNRLGQESGVEEGTGIGLVVTKQLVELMGGNIGVESTVNVGSEFWFELVRVVTPQLDIDPTIPEIELAKLSNNANLRTLLYVEDNPANLLLVEQIIENNSQLRMLSARDGHMGITLARLHSPDVILMDINLPGINGTSALKVLRKDPATKHIPVIALSANAMPRDIQKGLEAGFFRYLTKPIKINEFMGALDDALKFCEEGSVEELINTLLPGQR